MATQDIIQSLNSSRPVGPETCVEMLDVALGDGYVTPVFRFRAAEARAGRLPVLYVHGIQSHPGWFAASACHLAMHGHAVYSVTRRGSGGNAAARGDAPSAEALLDDVACALRWVAADSGQGRVHLLGVSWGGKLLAAAMLRGMGVPGSPLGSPVFASLTLLAPGLVPQVDVPLWTKLRIAWAMLTGPHRLFDIPLSDVELFTDNPAMQDYLRRDAHRLHKATARFLFASRKLDRMIARAPAGAIAVPTTLVMAETDRIIDNARTQVLVSRLTAGRAKTIQLPGHHTLEFEPDPQPLFEAITGAVQDLDGSSVA